MRGFRWLLLVVMVVIAGAVFAIYQSQRILERSNRRAVPPSIPLDTKTGAQDWEYGQSDNGKPRVRIKAANYKLAADSEHAELTDVELDLFTKNGLHYDQVKTHSATMTVASHKLYAPGDVKITLQVPSKGDPPHQLTSITTSGITFDNDSGEAVTDKHMTFTFEEGDGSGDGAAYDPATHSLKLNSNVIVNLRGKDGQGMPMKVECGQLSWNETTGVVVMGPWSRLTRDQTLVNAAESTVQLSGHDIKTIDAVHGSGTDKRPGRNVEYAAEMIHMTYNQNHEIDQITGTGGARLVAHGATSDTTITGNRVDLAFTQHEGEDVLSTAVAKGNGYLESKPIPDPKGETADTKIIKADTLDLKMRPDGKELERVNTQAPGTLEFLPNQNARHRRTLRAERMNIAYGAKNDIQSFHATNASTETWPSEQEKQRKKGATLPNSLTNSKVIDAAFDEKGQLTSMKQTDDFHYTEGDRKAQADLATFQQDTNVMNLERNSRLSDAQGTTTGDTIRIDQTTGDFDARGHVYTTRLPEGDKAESGMLDKGEATLGTADRVTSANRNHLVHYIGNAAVWQTSNRVQADRIDIDRDKKSLVADGKVVTQFEDKPKAENDAAAAGSGPPLPPAAKPKQPTFTIVKAPHMVYSDEERLAVYTGGADFWRPTMTVKTVTLKAYLNDQDSDADSKVNRAFGDGKCEVVQYAPDRHRVGNSEHAEYYTEDGKVILSGGQPKLNDSKTGNDTRGDKLTWFTDDDRLIVEGAPKQKTQSHLRKKT
jgi:lipopolysaccharide export system protein LptA